jgi:signal transduction histidine kinase
LNLFLTSKNDMKKKPNPKNRERRVENLEKRMRFIQNALELSLSVGDYQEEINNNFTLDQIFEETGKRINSLVKFEIHAFYIIDQDNSDLVLSVCRPDVLRLQLEAEVEFLIDKGFMAWALNERRGVTILSKDKARQIFIHVIATSSRIKGVFIGLFPVNRQRIPDAAFEILSITLRNVANALENVEYRGFRENQKRILEEQLHQKTKELIQYERKLQNTQKMEAIATLAGGIAHEFNNALTGVMLNIDLLKLTFPENGQIIKHVDAMKRSAKYMAQLTKQLLAYAQGGKYQVKNISFGEFMRDALPAVKHVIDPSIHVDTDLPSDLYNIRADLTQIQMVLAAILTNASEAIEAKGRILIHAQNEEIDELLIENDHRIASGSYVCLTIEDNGVGINENTCGRIFEPFFTTRFQGRGLGMAATYGIIKNHGGWISVDSEVGIGTKVRIFLPKAEIVSKEETEPKHIKTINNVGNGGIKKVDIAVSR